MAASSAPKKGEHPYRMKDVCELTGLSRQAVHFYVQQGLVPPGVKTGRNMAYYSEAHVERLQLIRQLQHERFLPLKAIKAILDDEAGGFEPDQRELLREVKTRLAGSNLTRPDLNRAVDAVTVCASHGVELKDVERMAELGLLTLVDGEGGALRMSEDDAWLIELWSQVRASGFTDELGFSVDDLAIYEEAVGSVFDHEKSRLLERMSELPPERVAEMIEQILPLIHMFIARFHTAHIRNFFAAME